MSNKSSERGSEDVDLGFRQLEWMGGGCGRVAHLESLDVVKESCHVIKFHFSLQNCNLLFKFVHPEVGEWNYVRTLQEKSKIHLVETEPWNPSNRACVDSKKVNDLPNPKWR
ncbi:hypothetical protein D5086_030325 [Populus alba]|uniref:Uncharacterized protein n=1 Tax=Populus alba TaxID=43335 RepID=A0ACC4AN56_POPAL